ncbi:hypothetical protein ACSYGO_36880 [Streptomyces krungchingensis]
MFDNAEYATRWQRRLKWYAEQDVLPPADGGGRNGVLVWTSDEHGVNEPEWRALAQLILRATAIRRPRPVPTKQTAATRPRPPENS